MAIGGFRGGLNSLTELDLDDCGCIADAGVERLAALVNLERLYLCRCPALSADAPLRLALCLPSTEVRHRIWPFIYPTPKLGFEYSRFILCGWLLIGCIRYY